MPRSTSLSTILNRMDRYTSLIVVPEAHKVRDIDEALRSLRREMPLPWVLKKGSIKLFDHVLEYPVAADHDELAYLEDSTQSFYAQTARFRYTSLQQFYEDPNNRNQIAEIWDGNTRYLGINFKDFSLGSTLLNNAETIADWSVSGDASAVVADTVTYKEGNGSVKVTITLSASSATIKNTLTTTISDTNYLKKYHFKWIYLDSAPTSIQIRLQTDDSNYLATTVTAQFSGQPFKADQWNLIAQDLNAATETGTFDETSIGSEKLILAGAATGTYFVDSSYLREWRLFDYWYYSIYNVLTVGQSVANQEYFYNSSDVYATDSELVGDSEWIDCIMYDAMLTEMVDQQDTKQKDEIRAKRNRAWENLIRKYPSHEPLVITNRQRFVDDFSYPTLYGNHR